LPGFVIEHIKQLMGWARQDAQPQLEERQSALNERERQLDDRVEKEKTVKNLEGQASRLEKRLVDQEVEESTLREKLAA